MAGRALSRFDAVVFDLFGTLVHEFPRADWDTWFVRSAGALGVDPTAFRREWEATSVERQTGRLGDLPANLREICRRAGARPTQRQIREAMRVREELYARWFVPVPGARGVLERLREEGTPTALISMCAPDTPPLWRASPLAGLVDVEVFSSEVGLRKPEPAIYLLACDRLGVRPERCLYVGDGSYRELSGARAVGMTAVLVLDPAADAAAINRPEAEDWTGARIARIAEVPGLL